MQWPTLERIYITCNVHGKTFHYQGYFATHTSERNLKNPHWKQRRERIFMCPHCEKALHSNQKFSSTCEDSHCRKTRLSPAIFCHSYERNSNVFLVQNLSTAKEKFNTTCKDSYWRKTIYVVFLEKPSHTRHILSLTSKRGINVSLVQQLHPEVKIKYPI